MIFERNILVTRDGCVKIIDFDWRGDAGKARYPSSINMGAGVRWHPGVTRGGLIKKEHDQHMFSRLTGAEWVEA